MSLDELRKRTGKAWPAIAKASSESAARMLQLQQIVQRGVDGAPIDSEDLNVVVFGSLARGEWTSGSDLDWTLLIDGGVDHEHSYVARILREKLQGAYWKDPGPTGTFGTLTFSHDLIHLIGGEDDTNRNTTRRMLLLLESCPVHLDGAYSRVLDGVLYRYVENDFRNYRLKVPRFLQNDLHRFWRTMCVDYANKYRERAGKGWAIRIVKLRISRKLIFAAGLLNCFSCDPSIVQTISPALAANPSPEGQVAYLRSLFRRPPLETLADALVRYGSEDTVSLIVDSYDQFLSALDQPRVRNVLEKLPASGEESDSDFTALIQCSRALEIGLLQLFFDSDKRIADLTRHYGIF